MKPSNKALVQRTFGLLELEALTGTLLMLDIITMRSTDSNRLLTYPLFNRRSCW